MAHENKYVLTADGKLYHAATNSNGWQKKNAKYISREWKNGRWVYTYPEDQNSLKNRLKNAVTATKKNVTAKVNTATKPIQDKTGITAAKSYKKASDTAATVASTSARSEAALKQKHEAKKQLMNTPIGKIQNATGNAKRQIENGATKVANWLGADEKMALDNATKKLNSAKGKESLATRNFDAVKSKGLANNQHALDAARAKLDRQTAEENWHNANAAFRNTPIGKLTTAAEVGSYWINQLIGGVKNRIETRRAEKEAAEVAERREANKAKTASTGNRQKDRLDIESDVATQKKIDDRANARDKAAHENRMEEVIEGNRADRVSENQQKNAADRQRNDNKKAAPSNAAARRDNLDLESNINSTMKDEADAARRKAETQKNTATTGANQKKRLDVESDVDEATRRDEEAAEEAARRKEELIKKGQQARARQRARN